MMKQQEHKMMNERVREFAKEAGYSPFDSQSELLEKFAELIVRECATWLEETVVECELAGELLRHFGVEE